MRPEWLDKAEYARLREIGKQLLRSRGAPLRGMFLDVATSAQWLAESLEKRGKGALDRRLLCKIHGNMCAMTRAPWEVAKTIVDCCDDERQPQEPARNKFADSLDVAQADAVETARDPSVAVFFPPVILNDAAELFIDDLVRMKGDKAAVVAYVTTGTTRVRIQASEIGTCDDSTELSNT